MLAFDACGGVLCGTLLRAPLEGLGGRDFFGERLEILKCLKYCMHPWRSFNILCNRYSGADNR